MAQREESKSESLDGTTIDSDKPSDGPTATKIHQPRSARGAESSGTVRNRKSSPAVIGRATGPVTPAGKQRSKYNAQTHGIFSQAIVLKGESRVEYEALLTGFRAYFQPAGVPEELLVERLATLAWRHRRLLVAEGAEIRRGSEFLDWAKEIEIQQEVEQIEEAGQVKRARVQVRPGAIYRIDNPTILAGCLNLLVQLRQEIKKSGFAEHLDVPVLEKLYGDRGRVNVHQTLLDSYTLWLAMSRVPEDVRKRERYLTPVQCQKAVLVQIDVEIRRLEQFQKSQASIGAVRIELDRLRLNVPESPAMDRLLRYEASLDRSFGRALGQLQRLQQTRLGQTGPPTVRLQLDD